ncbi:MAG: cell division protein FtsQ [Prevotella sp.]|nr:cell division protein FtsQ [Prevotella sp.]
MNWKKAFVITFNVIIAIYLLLAVTAFNKSSDEDMVCQDVHVNVNRSVIDGSLSAGDVRNMLNAHQLNPKGMAMSQVNLRAMEEMLNGEQLIEHAECYKTQEGKVCVDVTERVPVVRVMAHNGDDYYVDKDGGIMNNTGYACNLMVATGHISHDYAKQVLAPIGRLIMADDFWRSQIEQLNVLPDQTIELVPRVGRHIIYLGQPVGVTKKLDRLRKFYQYGLSQVGWNKYSRISVEFHNQIVCKKH